MSSQDTTGMKRSAEEASLPDNESGRDCHQPFLDRVSLPMNLIIGSILPFVPDRSTWNKLCVANKELRDAGRTMTPPWPQTTIQQMQNFTMATVFSPCGHYLASGTVRGAGDPAIVHILDRRNGQQTSLRGHLEDIFCLAFSDDGKYLASGGIDRLIRIWPTNSTRKPIQQSRNESLPGHSTQTVHCLAFASDSNILASGSRNEIKLWNVEDGLCIQTFDQQHGSTSSLVFSGVGANIQCLAATTDGSLIRISRKSSKDSEFTSDVIVDGATRFVNASFSSCGSFLATVDLTNKLCLYEVKMDGISMLQSVTLPAYCVIRTNAGMAFSPDSKMLAVISDTSGEDDTVIRLLDMKDFSRQRQLKWQLRGEMIVSLAVDPSNRYVATASSHGAVRLWTV
jgi:WD40 repeat protein